VGPRKTAGIAPNGPLKPKEAGQLLTELELEEDAKQGGDGDDPDDLKFYLCRALPAADLVSLQAPAAAAS
jgi:hypothetical protein